MTSAGPSVSDLAADLEDNILTGSTDSVSSSLQSMDEASPSGQDEEEELEELSTDWQDIYGRGPAKKPESQDLEKIAAENGFGKLYAAFGGGQDGIQACSAGMPSILSSPILSCRL